MIGLFWGFLCLDIGVLTDPWPSLARLPLVGPVLGPKNPPIWQETPLILPYYILANLGSFYDMNKEVVSPPFIESAAEFCGTGAVFGSDFVLLK